MYQICLRESSQQEETNKTQCNCIRVTNLDPYNIFKICRLPSTSNDKEEHHENYLPQFKIEKANIILRNSSQKISELYLRIRSKKWEGLGKLAILREDIESLNSEEKEILFSLVKRKKEGISEKIELFTINRIVELIKMERYNRKSDQNFRKLIIRSFYKYKLDQIDMENPKIISNKIQFNQKRFILHYFKDYLGEFNHQKIKSLTDLVFGHYRLLKTGQIKSGIKGVWNLHYLSGILPKSDKLKVEMLHYTKNIFLRMIIKNYDKEVERFIAVFMKKLENGKKGMRNNELFLIQKKIQKSNKFKYPWDIMNYQEARNYFCRLLEDDLYLEKPKVKQQKKHQEK